MHPYHLSINQLNQFSNKNIYKHNYIFIFHIIFSFILFIWIKNKFFNININHTIQNSTFIWSSNSAFSFNGNFMAGKLVKSEFVRLSVVFMRYFPYSFLLNLFMVPSEYSFLFHLFMVSKCNFEAVNDAAMQAKVYGQIEEKWLLASVQPNRSTESRGVRIPNIKDIILTDWSWKILKTQ